MLIAIELQKKLDDAWHELQQALLGTYAEGHTPSQFALDEDCVDAIVLLAKQKTERLAKDKQEKELLEIYERVTSAPDFDEDQLMEDAYMQLSEHRAQRSSDDAINPTFEDIVGDMIDTMGFDGVKTFLEA